MQAPLTALLVNLEPFDATFTNWLNTGGASPCLILYKVI